MQWGQNSTGWCASAAPGRPKVSYDRSRITRALRNPADWLLWRACNAPLPFGDGPCEASDKAAPPKWHAGVIGGKRPGDLKPPKWARRHPHQTHSLQRQTS